MPASDHEGGSDTTFSTHVCTSVVMGAVLVCIQYQWMKSLSNIYWNVVSSIHSSVSDPSDSLAWPDPIRVESGHTRLPLWYRTVLKHCHWSERSKVKGQRSLCFSSICSGHHRETAVHPGRCVRPHKGAARKVSLHTRALPHHVHPKTLDHQTGEQWLALCQFPLSLSSLFFSSSSLPCSHCSPSLYPPFPSSSFPFSVYFLPSPLPPLSLPSLSSLSLFLPCSILVSVQWRRVMHSTEQISRLDNRASV